MDSGEDSSFDLDGQFEKFVVDSDVVNEAHNFKIFHPDCKSKYRLQAYKLMIANTLLANQVRDLIEEKKQIKSMIRNKSSKKRSPKLISRVEQPKIKRFRRPACEIDRLFTCPIMNCSKVYGSEGSLTQHLRLKHPNLNELIQTQNQNSNQNQIQVKIE